MKKILILVALLTTIGITTQSSVFLKYKNDERKLDFPEYSETMNRNACTCQVSCWGVRCCNDCPDGGGCSCACIGWRNCACSSCKMDFDLPQQLKRNKGRIILSLSKDGYEELRDFCYFLVNLENNDQTLVIAKKIAEEVTALGSNDFNRALSLKTEIADKLSQLPQKDKSIINRYLKEVNAPESYYL